MARKRKGSYSPGRSLVLSQRNKSRPVFPERRYEVAGSILRVTTYLPRSVARRARREIYTYPYPKQVQKRGRVIRLALSKPRGNLVKAVVRIRMPRRLPVVRGSYVSITPRSVNIHSRSQLEGVLDAQEFNRRRYSEYKRNHRKGSHGQLDSRGSRRFGSVAAVARKGGSVDQIADAALVARAIAQRR